MQWFVAKIVYQIISGNGDHAPQFDEQLRLISADNKQEAWKRASEMGIQEQYAFRNQRQELVEWRFINVPEVNMLSSLDDGMELYSRIEEPGDANAYISWLQVKAAHIKGPALIDKRA
ncbi:DUF4288 domain-containing protein [Chitinophaga rhizophila]|uniref:DUF4288 domain-containing protein n=1 Tax=Chitinophaga rhizophila TaxID=2866212 RepID=A0ABS7GBV3_9BACT|nr:DUF4288 domain-containing protein [Chitinophaga rhizophila]MBW8685152.1 DUF4288 domain-containing protein [Chitinophaga rhizophila]